MVMKARKQFLSEFPHIPESTTILFSAPPEIQQATFLGSHCTNAWGILEEQALLNNHQFLKDCTVNAEEITYRILTAKSGSMGFHLS